jgi:hypothetical protein
MGAVDPLFAHMKDGILSIDPVTFCEKNLTLDGQSFRLHGNGFKPLADIYRYIGMKAIESDGKPVVFTKSRQVGATTMAAAIELFYMCSGLFGTAGRPPMRIMHCFPLLELGYVYTKTKLNTMMTTARPHPEAKSKGRRLSVIEAELDRSASSSESLQFKQFKNGNHTLIDSTGPDGDRLRMRTVDAIFFDEAQDTAGIAMANTIKTQLQAKYGKVGKGVQAYLGTPKQKGSDFHHLWMSSSRQYYFLHCEECDEYFPLYTPESNDWEEVWIDDNIPADYVDPKTKLKPHGFVVKCGNCGHEQDKRPSAERGKWVASNDKDCDYVGFHINQLYMPMFSREDIMREKPENHPINTERIYQNEVLGEFFSGDSSLITPEEIRKICGDKGRKFRRGISISDNKRVYLGVDWGEKIDVDQLAVGDREKKQRGQSYSSGVILSTDGPHILSIDYAKLLKSNEPDYKKAFIDQVFRQYSVNLGVGDIGHAYDLSKTLQQEYGDRFLTSRALGSKIKNHVRFCHEIYPKEIQFEKDYFIEDIHEKMRKGEIRFPLGSYEQVGWLIMHCTSMDIKITMDRGGNPIMRYVKGSTPNDGFMALINAYLGWMFESTNKFEIIDPARMQTDTTKASYCPAILSYLPGIGSKRFN